MPIKVYNRMKEIHVNDLNVPIYRPYILSNPYTHIKERKTKAKYVVPDRETAIKKYSEYFDEQYNTNKDFHDAVDVLYNLYKSGETIYLECYCAPEPCHGDVIEEKIQSRLIREKLAERKKTREKTIQRKMGRNLESGEIPEDSGQDNK